MFYLTVKIDFILKMLNYEYTLKNIHLKDWIS